MKTKLAFFVGCTTPARVGAYELSTRKVAEALDVELVDLKFSCCGSTYMDSIDRTTALAIAGRNICLAEEKGLDIVTLCNGCYEVLTKANKALIEEKETREKVNKVLSETDHKFKGTVEIKHFVKLLAEDIGFRKLKESVKRPYKNLRIMILLAYF